MSLFEPDKRAIVQPIVKEGPGRFKVISPIYTEKWSIWYLLFQIALIPFICSFFWLAWQTIPYW